MEEPEFFIVTCNAIYWMLPGDCLKKIANVTTNGVAMVGHRIGLENQEISIGKVVDMPELAMNTSRIIALTFNRERAVETGKSNHLKSYDERWLSETLIILAAIESGEFPSVKVDRKSLPEHVRGLLDTALSGT